MKKTSSLIIVFSLLLLGCAHNKTTKSWKGNYNEVEVVIENLLNQNKNIRLAILIETIDFDGNKNWEKFLSMDIPLVLEHRFLRLFSKYKNFKLLERNSIGKILKEQNFQLSGITSNESIVKLGEFAGASHILLAIYSSSSFSDNYREKIIDVEKGTILASSLTDME